MRVFTYLETEIGSKWLVLDFSVFLYELFCSQSNYLNKFSKLFKILNHLGISVFVERKFHIWVWVGQEEIDLKLVVPKVLSRVSFYIFFGEGLSL